MIVWGVSIYELIDRLQDIITLFGVPIAIVLLWKVYTKVNKLLQQISSNK